MASRNESIKLTRQLGAFCCKLKMRLNSHPAVIPKQVACAAAPRQTQYHTSTSLLFSYWESTAKVRRKARSHISVYCASPWNGAGTFPKPTCCTAISNHHLSAKLNAQSDAEAAAYVQGVQPCSGSLQQIMETGRPCYKARLLHYFADPGCAEKGSEAQAPWCGWHTDHSSLTGPTPLSPPTLRPEMMPLWPIELRM